MGSLVLHVRDRICSQVRIGRALEDRCRELPNWLDLCPVRVAGWLWFFDLLVAREKATESASERQLTRSISFFSLSISWYLSGFFLLIYECKWMHAPSHSHTDIRRIHYSSLRTCLSTLSLSFSSVCERYSLRLSKHSFHSINWWWWEFFSFFLIFFLFLRV